MLKSFPLAGPAFRRLRAVATLAGALLVAHGWVGQVQASPSTLTVPHTFNGNTEGYNLAAPLVFGADGNLYGTTQNGAGSANRGGTVFRVTPGGDATIVYQFADLPDQTSPEFPYAPLLADRDGNFYGTTYQGGTTLGGTVFKLTPQGAFTVLHNFPVQNGFPRTPIGGVIRGQDGALYGTLSAGGPNGSGADGAVYRLAQDGTYTVLHQFDRTVDGTGQPLGALVQAADGQLYGLTHGIEDGVNNAAVFAVRPDGTGFRVLHTFAYSMHNYFNAGLLLAGDGNLYGATQGTATAGTDDIYGSVFRVTAGGTFTTLHSFNASSEGAYPSSELIQARDGLIYGTLSSKGTGGLGGVFRMTVDGSVFETLYQFSNSDPAGAPVTGLAQAPDGAFYGLANSPNAVYKIVPSHPAFFAGEVPLSQGVYYLSFANANIFGYYEYLSDPHFVYHFDLGFEYCFDAGDGHEGLYFYDFKSSDFFYTSPTFGFPYLYDFGLQAFLYYYPDPTNPQRYNTNGVRYFYNFSTGKIITK